MASPCSDHLRRKSYEALKGGDGSLPKLAQRFRVNLGWTEKIMRTIRKTGKVE